MKPAKGLTLVEVLVALLALALMSLMSHQALDLLLRSQFGVDRYSKNLSSLQIALAQWRRDLERIDRTPYVNALQWDGQVLRLLRRSASGDALLVVAWAVQDGIWRRWQSPPLRDREALLQAWQQSVSAVLALPRASESSAAPAARADLIRLERWELDFQGQAAPGVSGRGDTRLRELPRVIRLRLLGLAATGITGPLQIDCAL